METILNSSVQDAKNQIKIWLDDLQDENSVMRVVSFFRNDILKKEKTTIKPMTEKELRNKVVKAINSEKSYSIEEARAIAKTWSKRNAS